jgi:malate dehydrogenase (oxaloacetate-decarboxylating)
MLAAARAIAGCVEQGELNSSYIVPSVFDPAVAPAVAHAVREAATRQGNATPAVVEVDHALEDDTVPAYQPHGAMEGMTSAL